jgi:hypothetical protein
MKEPLKTQRNQLNLHLRTKDSTKAAEPWPSATTASGVTVSATSTTGSGGGREHQRRSGRSSGRAAAQAAMENIHAQQREISNNDSPTINFRPAPAQPQLTAAEYMQQLQIHQLLLLRQQQQQQQQQRQ